MKKELISILACPVCNGELELRVGHEKGGEIISGSLICSGCQETYPVENTIPNLLIKKPEN